MTRRELRFALLLSAFAWAIIAAGVGAGILGAWAIDDWRNSGDSPGEQE